MLIPLLIIPFFPVLQIFEQSLKTKYDHIVDALQETVKSEHDSRLLRTVKALEMNARYGFKE